jgi:hypothetical protein
MSDLVELLRAPDTSSSIFPLIVVTTLLIASFLVALVLVIYRVWQAVHGRRAPTPSSSPTHPHSSFPGLFRRAIQNIFTLDPSAHPVVQSELEQLHQQIDRLQRENQSIRDLHAKAIGRISELESEISVARRKIEESRHLLERETQHRINMEQKSVGLERQVEEVIAEVEKIYQQNADSAKLSGLSEILGAIPANASVKVIQTPKPNEPPADPHAKVAEQEAEIAALKSVLTACRDRMVEMSNESPAVPKKRR